MQTETSSEPILGQLRRLVMTYRYAVLISGILGIIAFFTVLLVIVNN